MWHSFGRTAVEQNRTDLSFHHDRKLHSPPPKHFPIWKWSLFLQCSCCQVLFYCVRFFFSLGKNVANQEYRVHYNLVNWKILFTLKVKTFSIQTELCYRGVQLMWDVIGVVYKAVGIDSGWGSLILLWECYCTGSRTNRDSLTSSDHISGHSLCYSWALLCTSSYKWPTQWEIAHVSTRLSIWVCDLCLHVSVWMYVFCKWGYLAVIFFNEVNYLYIIYI